jgi:hypothetical protein
LIRITSRAFRLTSKRKATVNERISRLRSRYFFAAVFFCLAAALTLIATRTDLGVWSLPLSWLSFDLGGVALAYLVNWKTVFGKTAAGSLRLGHVLVMLPYLALTWGVWHLQIWISKEPISNEIAPGLFVGRRCRLAQMPSGTSKVIDFTAEFSGEGAARRTVQWLSIPILDGCGPDLDDYRAGFAFVGDPGDSKIYMHCANGHGRSVTFACALLVKLGIASTLEDAIAMVLGRRARASLNQEQRKSLQRVFLS